MRGFVNMKTHRRGGGFISEFGFGDVAVGAVDGVGAGVFIPP